MELPMALSWLLDFFTAVVLDERIPLDLVSLAKSVVSVWRFSMMVMSRPS